MSFWRTYYHLVWATKDIEPLITPNREAQLVAYLIRKANELGVRIYAVGVMSDHIHLIVAIPPRMAVADVVKGLKGFVSFAFGKGFSWQRGYGVMTFGEGQRSQAMSYVQNQRQLHAHGETNRWLERYDEYDEGPPDYGLVVDDLAVSLRESGPGYDVLGEAPF